MGLLDGQTQQSYYQGNDHGDYQFTSLDDIINQFMAVYVGEDKIIPKAKRMDVAFHAQRALAELSFDTLKSCKAQEITLPPSLQMTLPQDYVNYTKISWVDSAGIKHLLYPTSKTSNPTKLNQTTAGYFDTEDQQQTFEIHARTGTIASSNALVLDGLYKNILVGMRIRGSVSNALYETAFDGNIVEDVRHDETTNITTVYMNNIVISNGIGNNYLAVFYNDDGSPVIPSENVKVLDMLYLLGNGGNTYSNDWYPALDNDWENVNIGDIVSSRFFPLGTTIVNISNNTTGQGVVEFSNDVLPSYSDGSLPIWAGGGDKLVVYSPYAVESTAWSNYKSGTPSENQDDYQDDTYWPMDGSRFGLDPQHAQANGSFYIDCVSGKIHFSSNVSGKTVILDYISDSLGTDGEMQVHKFAEEAMYKWISHAIMAGRANVPEYQVNRFKKERFAAIRTAKLRLSNLKLEELTQILRGKSKQIKH